MTKQIEHITGTAADIRKVAAALSNPGTVRVLAAIVAGDDTYDKIMGKTGGSYNDVASAVRDLKRIGLIEVESPRPAWKEYRKVRNPFIIRAIENDGVAGTVAKMIFNA